MGVTPSCPSTLDIPQPKAILKDKYPQNSRRGPRTSRRLQREQTLEGCTGRRGAGVVSSMHSPNNFVCPASGPSS